MQIAHVQAVSRLALSILMATVVVDDKLTMFFLSFPRKKKCWTFHAYCLMKSIKLVQRNKEHIKMKIRSLGLIETSYDSIAVCRAECPYHWIKANNVKPYFLEKFSLQKLLPSILSDKIIKIQINPAAHDAEITSIQR